MTKRLQFKRFAGNAANTYVGADGELIVDTTMRTLSVHDGHTPGGSRLLNAEFLNTVASPQPAYNQANTGTVLAQASYNQANVTIGVDATQNTRLTVIEGTNVSQNVRLNYSNTAITIIQGVDVGQNSRMAIIEGTNVTQNTNLSATDNKMQNAYAQANTGTVLAQASFNVANSASANTIIIQGVDVTQNTKLAVIEGTNASQNVRLDFSNAAITIIQGVDVTQNTRLTVAEGTDLSQNVRLDFSNAAITIIQGVDVAQNTRLTVIEGTDASQNVRLDYSNTAITIIQGADVSQNARLTVIEGTDASQNVRLDFSNAAITIIQGVDVAQNSRMAIIENTNTSQNVRLDYSNTAILATDGKLQNAYAQANTGTVLAQTTYNQSNASFLGVNTAITIIQGTDASQNVRLDYSNTRMIIIEGVNATQNTNISNKLNLTGSLNQTISGNVTISQDLIVAGNLLLTGNINTQNVQQLSVADPLIVLGIGNYFSDTKDIGFAAHYNDGTNAHTGLIRDSDTKEYYVFQGYVPELDANNNIVISNPTFRTANLNANVVKANILSSGNSIFGTNISSSTTVYGGFNVDANEPSTDTRIVRTWLPPASFYNASNFFSEQKVAAGHRYNWYTDYWQIGANRGFSYDIGPFVISRNGTVTNAINVQGINYFYGNMPATNTTSGTIVVTGGAGISGSLYANTVYANNVDILSLAQTANTRLKYTAATTPPSSNNIGDQWYNTSSDVLYEYIVDGTSAYWVDVGSSSIASGATIFLPSRSTTSITTSSLANNSTANVQITGFKSYILQKMTTSCAAWVRLYTDGSSRSNDASRLQSVDPLAGTGVIAEFVTTGANTQLVTPGVFGFNNDVTPNTTIYAAITNQSGTSNTVTVTLSLLQAE